VLVVFVHKPSLLCIADGADTRVCELFVDSE
jgi:hypothetical protein